MQIALLRHGKPDYPNSAWVSGNGYKEWLDKFNSNGLPDNSLPPTKLLEETRNYNSIVCSNLNRSIESANLLELDKEIITDKLFREAELPHWNFSKVKLPPSLWTAISRTLWLSGYSPNCESKSRIKIRASLAAHRLIEIAENNCYVLLVAHGFINRYISKVLVVNGWQGPKSYKHGYWALNEYKKEP